MTILRGRLSYLVHYYFSAYLLRPIAYSVCGCMLSMCVCVCVCVCVSDAPVCGMSGRERQVRRAHTHA
jgi:hypothetical protein